MPETDMIVWLRQQLDTDKRLARSVEPVPRQRWEAVSGEWGPQLRTERGSEPHWSHEIQAEVWRCDDEMDGCPDIARAAMAEAEFIATNDPDRVVRQVQAHRAILDLHEPRTDYKGRPQCDYCASLCHSRSGLGCDEPDAPYPCHTVKLLVSIYSDRDGYRQEWSA